MTESLQIYEIGKIIRGLIGNRDITYVPGFDNVCEDIKKLEKQYFKLPTLDRGIIKEKVCRDLREISKEVIGIDEIRNPISGLLKKIEGDKEK